MRKPILLIDDSNESKTAFNILLENKIEFVSYHIKKFEDSCCGELPTTKAPSIISPEGIFKGLDNIKKYLNDLSTKNKQNIELENDSAYW